MDFGAVLAIAVLVFVSYVVGQVSASGDVNAVKRENERLNAEVKRLTSRDKNGRFNGSTK